MLTAKGAVTDRVQCLDRGADDYLVKPFEFVELVARLNAIYRRSIGQGTSTMALGSLSFDLSGQQVTVNGKRLELTGKEYDLLAALAAKSGQLLKRNTLVGILYQLDSLPPPLSQYRMPKGLYDFGFVPRTDAPGAFYFNAVLDKVNPTVCTAAEEAQENPTCLRNDEVGTSLSFLLSEDFGTNFNVTKGALPIPGLAPVNGKDLHVVASVQLHQYLATTRTAQARRCPNLSPVLWVGDSNTGYCSAFAEEPIGAASARMTLGVIIYEPGVAGAPGHSYWLDLVLWKDGNNLFTPYKAGDPLPIEGLVMNPDVLLEVGPNAANFEQIYVDMNKLDTPKQLAKNLPPCPALDFGVPNAAPGRQNDPWYAYGIDVTALAKCLPWTRPIDVTKAQVTSMMVGPVINGAGRLYWATRDFLAWNPN